jgi:hypothetical protein
VVGLGRVIDRKKPRAPGAGKMTYVIYFVARAVAVDFLEVFFPELAMF